MPTTVNYFIKSSRDGLSFFGPRQGAKNILDVCKEFPSAFFLDTKGSWDWKKDTQLKESCVHPGVLFLATRNWEKKIKSGWKISSRDICREKRGSGNVAEVAWMLAIARLRGEILFPNTLIETTTHTENGNVVYCKNIPTGILILQAIESRTPYRTQNIFI